VDKTGQFLKRSRTALLPHLLTDTAKKHLADVEEDHANMVRKLDALYAMLEVHVKIPTTLNISFEFMKTLLAAHTLKITIRKKAINMFLERERLDQAVSGKHHPLGKSLNEIS